MAARPMATDPFQNFRFHVVAANKPGGIDPFGPTEAGFNSVTLPTQTTESAEYKEGIMVYRRKFPGDTTFDDVTLTRGVTVTGSEFWTWANQTSSGREYRIDFDILQYHRDNISSQETFEKATPSRRISCTNAFPISVKSGGDMDSMTSEISIQEITVAIETFTITNLRT